MRRFAMIANDTMPSLPSLARAPVRPLARSPAACSSLASKPHPQLDLSHHARVKSNHNNRKCFPFITRSDKPSLMALTQTRNLLSTPVVHIHPVMEPHSGSRLDRKRPLHGLNFICLCSGSLSASSVSRRPNKTWILSSNAVDYFKIINFIEYSSRL